MERELKLQVGLKQEMEMAMRLLEKDTHEKQETLQALRQQLDQVKTLNLQMFHKTQVTHTDRNTQTHTSSSKHETHTYSLSYAATPLDRECVCRTVSARPRGRRRRRDNWRRR